MMIQGVSNVEQFLTFLSGVVLDGYHAERALQIEGDSDYDADEQITLVDVTRFWLENDMPEATMDQVYTFMFENRRV
jgi:hypothetical protein